MLANPWFYNIKGWKNTDSLYTLLYQYLQRFLMKNPNEFGFFSFSLQPIILFVILFPDPFSFSTRCHTDYSISIMTYKVNLFLTLTYELNLFSQTLSISTWGPTGTPPYSLFYLSSILIFLNTSLSIFSNQFISTLSIYYNLSQTLSNKW